MTPGDGFAGGLKRMRDDGVAATLLDRVKAIVVIEVRQAESLVSRPMTTAQLASQTWWTCFKPVRPAERATWQRCRLISRSRPHLGT